MAALPLPQPHPTRRRADPALLGRLRRAGRAARLGVAVMDGALDQLLHALPGAIGRRLTFHETGAAELSFDEAWLIGVIEAIRTGDADRYRFALLSRMRREPASRLHFLFCKVAHSLDARPEHANLAIRPAIASAE